MSFDFQWYHQQIFYARPKHTLNTELSLYSVSSLACNFQCHSVPVFLQSWGHEKALWLNRHFSNSVLTTSNHFITIR